ncbi:uncharacterized protein B0I36DRAFT_365115 [Microdochium trichocladiopsis]|uniref:Transmembrane protein n=1 Tax=Microdochium trichocladiopsis TaxID=1682393 RepID=A0A9P8Y355_9PEZI|nr:uncharacterized protein B0I36DRAFT_365115 [Microdochium trichocladiopsis]KAH7027994.1 hypothetical protein B0I36DRAFT_365115 [Microdochium trichocladiopsis]
MAYNFPSTISAARISTFISTAAWIQGTVATAGDVWLPEDALNNFLQRQSPAVLSQRDANNGTTPSPGGAAPPESEDSSVGDEESADSSDSSADGESGASTADGDAAKDGMDPITSSPVQGGLDGTSGGSALPADGGDASRAASGLSPGGQAAIAVWVVIAVVAAGVAFWWFRRRRRRNAQSSTASVQDPEAARSQPMAAQGALPSILPPMDPAFIQRSESRQSGAGFVMRAQPQDDDGVPYEPASQSWRQSPPPGAYGGGIAQTTLSRSNSRVGLPSNPRPGSQRGSQRELVIGAPMMGGPSYRRDQDARTVVTADTESTIFEWR